MNERKEPRCLVRAAGRPAEQSYCHPLNPRAEIHGLSLSGAAGLERIGFHLIRIAPGKEANVYHSHTAEEEFYFILEGRGVAEIDGAEHEVGPGDFIGFPTPSVGHLLKNPFDEDLVYLVGGERRPMEFASFPHLDKHVIRVRGTAYVVDAEHLQPFWKSSD